MKSRIVARNLRRAVTAFIALSALAVPVLAFAEDVGKEGIKEAAAEIGAEAHRGIPMSVTWQAINFVLYVGVLVYFLRHPIKNFFSQREENYRQALVRGEQSRRDAEKRKREIQERLNELEGSATETMAKARAEAAALAQQIQQDAQSLTVRLKAEASRAATIEIERAKSELREDMLNQAITSSRKILEDKIQEGDQKRLQTEFVDKIQEVR